MRTTRLAFYVSVNYPGRTLLGSPSNHARPRIARRLTVAAAPALFGVAAAITVVSTSGHTSTPAAAKAPAAQSHARQAVDSAARLVSVNRPAGTTAKRHSALPASYTVVSGDDLSAIAQRFYASANYWPVLYWANHSRIQYANDIQVGQVLTVPVKPAKIPAAPTTLSAAPAPASVTTSASGGSAASGSGQSAPVRSPAGYSVAPATVSTSGGGSFQSCVIARESGGNSQVMNASGHYGLYQFSASTWAAYGGNPADFGNASVAEQNQVFNNAIAAGGASNWSPYDGC